MFNSMCPQDGESSKTSEPAAGLGRSQISPRNQLSWCQNLQHTSHTSPLQGNSNRGWQGRCKTKWRWKIHENPLLSSVVAGCNFHPAAFQMPGAAKSIKKLDSSELSEWLVSVAGPAVGISWLDGVRRLLVEAGESVPENSKFVGNPQNFRTSRRISQR